MAPKKPKPPWSKPKPKVKDEPRASDKPVLGFRMRPQDGPLPNLTPRQPDPGLRHEHKLFVYEYVMNDLHPADAYETVYGKQSTREVAHQSAYRIMRRPDVMELIDKLRCQMLDKAELTAEWVLVRWKLLYFAAVKQQDWAAAHKALDCIAKHMGLYEKHNRQRVSYSQADVDRLKQELTEAGFDLSKLEPSDN